MTNQRSTDEPKAPMTEPLSGQEKAESQPAREPAGDAGDEKADMTQQITKLTRERDEYLDMAQRLQAEFDNFRRRNRDTRQEALQEGACQVVSQILPVLDNLERAADAAAEAGTADAVVEGVTMVLRQMKETLQKLGVEEICAHGQCFDPNLHNAVMQGEADQDHPAGTVLEVLQKGYKTNEKILRHSMVKVAK